MSPAPEHLMIAPILVPLVAGALMLSTRTGGQAHHQPGRRRRCCRSSPGAPHAGGGACGRTEVGLYLLGDWPSPFAIVLVLDRLSALMLLLTSVLALPALVFALGGLGPAGPAFPQPLPVPAHGAERRVPDRGPLQPLRLLRGAAGRVLRADAARVGAAQGAGGPALYRDQPRGVAPLPDRGQPDLRGHRHAQHGRPRVKARRRCPRPTARCCAPARRRSASPSWSRRRCGRSASGCRSPTWRPPRRSPRSSRS